MAKEINFVLREMPGRQMTLRSSPGEEYTQSTGDRTTVPYSGPWADCLAEAQAAISTASVAEDVTCELECMDGGVAELRITTEIFRKPSEGGGAEGEPDDDTTSDSPGDSEDNPTYSCSSCLVQQPILTHPKFEDIKGDELRALKAMLDGQDENSLLDADPTTGTSKTIADCITTDAGDKAREFISKGIYIWNDVSVEVTARWKGSSSKYEAGKIYASVPGGFSAAAGRNWLCSGAGVEKNGSEKWCTASFRLSSAGGWNKYLYES